MKNKNNSNHLPKVEGVAFQEIFSRFFNDEVTTYIKKVVEDKVKERVEAVLSEMRRSAEANYGVDEQVTIAQICEALQVTPATVHRWMNNNLLPYQKVGRLTRFRRKDVNHLIESGALGKYNNRLASKEGIL